MTNTRAEDDIPPDVDPYSVLGVNSKSTTKEIERAYKLLAQQHHPDKGGSGDYFKTITMCYRHLKNPELRALYDRRHGTVNMSRRLNEWREKPTTSSDVQQQQQQQSTSFRGKRANNDDDDDDEDDDNDYIPEATTTNSLGPDDSQVRPPDAVTFDLELTKIPELLGKWGFDVNRNLTVTRVETCIFDKFGLCPGYAILKVNNLPASITVLRSVADDEAISLLVKVPVKMIEIQRQSETLPWGFGIDSGTMRIAKVDDGTPAGARKWDLLGKRVLFVGKEYVMTEEELIQALRNRAQSLSLKLIIA
eukprot:PhF_6_TR21707/c0_g1_i1/m.31005